MAIKSYADEGTRDIANRIRSRLSRQALPSLLHDIALRKLVFLDNAQVLEDLVNWRSLLLEELRGDRQGQYSIRINVRYRICFRWSGTDTTDVEIVDYH